MRSQYACLAVLLTTTAVALAQDDDPPTIGGMVAKTVGEVASGVAELQQSKANFAEQIRNARARYWATYNGAGFPEAAAEFNRVLLAKDMIYLTMYLPEGFPAFGPDGARGRLVEGMLSVDNGIPPSAFDAFNQLLNTIREDLGAKNSTDRIFVNPRRLPFILEKRQDLLIAYIRARDWHEVMNSGMDPSKIMSPRAYLLGVLESMIANEQFAGPKPDPRDEAREAYAVMVKAFGEEPVLKAAKALLEAPREKGGVVREGAVRPLPPYHWFAQRLGDESPAAYAVSMVTGLDGWNHIKERWVTGAARYDELVKKHGAQRVHAVAEAIRSAPRHSDDLADFSGAATHKPKWWFAKLLSDPTAKLPTKNTLPLLEAAAETEALLALVGKKTHVRVRGEVERVELRPKGEGRTRDGWIILKGVDPSLFRCDVRDFYWTIQEKFPPGTPVEVNGWIEPYDQHPQGPFKAGMAVIPLNIKRVQAVAHPATAPAAPAPSR